MGEMKRNVYMIIYGVNNQWTEVYMYVYRYTVWQEVFEFRLKIFIGIVRVCLFIIINMYL